MLRTCNNDFDLVTPQPSYRDKIRLESGNINRSAEIKLPAFLDGDE